MTQTTNDKREDDKTFFHVKNEQVNPVDLFPFYRSKNDLSISLSFI